MLKTTEGIGTMAGVALGAVIVGLAAPAIWVYLGGRRVRRQVHEATERGDAGRLPEQ